MDKKMLEKLKKFNVNFAKQKQRAQELGSFGSEVPDGKYLAKISECAIKESNAGQLHFVFTFEIAESAEDETLIGAKVSKWAGIEGEDQMAYLIRDLHRFGLEAESAEDLAKIADLLNKEKPEVKITLKSKESGQFVYIDKCISELDAGDMAADEDADDSDEAPEEESGDDDDVDDSEEEAEEATEEEEESGDVDIEVGTVVTFTTKKGESVTGEVTRVDDAAGTVDIKTSKSSFKGIAVDRLSLPETEETEDSEEESEEEESEEEKVEVKVKPVAKKVTPKKEERTVAKKPAAKVSAKKSSGKKK